MKHLFRRKDPKNSSSGSLFVFIREGDKDTYWPLHPLSHEQAGTLVGIQHDASTPEDAEWVNVISFSPLDDVEIRAQRKESTHLLTKRLMAETGLRLIGWRQRLVPASDDHIVDLSIFKRWWISIRALLERKDFSHQTGSRANNAPVGHSLNRSNDLSGSEWFYATASERMATSAKNVCVWPGRAMVRKLLAQAWSEAPQPDNPYVTGVVFSGSLHTLVVFFKASATGGLESMVSVDLPAASQTTQAHENDSHNKSLQLALENYLQHVRLASLDSASEFPPERVCLFDGGEFVKQLTEKSDPHLLRPYPKEQELLGIGRTTWWNLTCNLSACVLLGVVVTTLYASTAIQWTKHASSVRETELDRAYIALRNTILSRWGSITREGSVPIDQAIRLAQGVYAEGRRTEIDVDRQKLLIKTISKVNHSANVPEVLLQLINTPPPQGCTRRSPETNLQLSELYISYECPSTDHRISALLTGDR